MAAQAQETGGPFSGLSVGGVLAAILAAVVACELAELAGFVIVRLRPWPDNLDVVTAWHARPTYRWVNPLLAVAVAAWLTRIPWKPAKLLDMARGRDRAGRATFGLIAWCCGVAMLLTWFVFGLDGAFALIVLVVFLIWLAAYGLHHLLAHAGLPNWASTIFLSALIGTASGALAELPPRTFECRSEAGLALRSGERIACRSIVWFSDRKAVIVNGADGSSRLLAKSEIDPASVVPAIGPRGVLLHPLE